MTHHPAESLVFRVPPGTAEALASPGLVAELSKVLASARREWVLDVPAGSLQAEGEPWSDHVAQAVIDWLIGRCTVETEQSPALALIAAERIRHLSKGYDFRHDDRLDDAQLVDMAVWYADDEASTVDWPWADDWPQRGDRGRDLIRAASLLAAEIDRLMRTGWRPWLP